MKYDVAFAMFHLNTSQEQTMGLGLGFFLGGGFRSQQ